MSILLNLDSGNLNYSQVSHDYKVEYPAPIDISDGVYELALIKMNCWYSWYNISAAKGNNTLRYHNGVGWSGTITIPDGQYTLPQMNDYLHSEMYSNGDYTIDAYGNTVYDVIIEPNYSTLRVKITLTNSYQLDLSLSDLHLLLGFTQVVLSHTGAVDGVNVANINDSINTLIIHCNVISGNASFSNSIQSDILHSFTPETSPGSNIVVSPAHKIYLPVEVHGNLIREIRVYITDNLGRPVDFQNEPITYLFHLRRSLSLSK